MARILADMQILRGNLRAVAARCRVWGVDLVPVLKGVAAWLPLASLCQEEGLDVVAVSTAAQAAALTEAGMPRPFMLDLPSPHACQDVVRHAARCHVSSLETAQALARQARALQVRHGALLMIDLGDGREGCRADEAAALAREIRQLAHSWFDLDGIATNFGCMRTFPPSPDRLEILAALAAEIGCGRGAGGCNAMGGVVSLGGSVLLPWLDAQALPACVTELRVGEALLLGNFMGQDCRVPGLAPDGFVLAAEVLESRRKEGRRRIILDLGVLSVAPDRLTPVDPGLRLAGASSDYLVFDVEDCPREFAVGDEVRLRPMYESLARAFHATSVKKPYIVEPEQPQALSRS